MLLATDTSHLAPDTSHPILPLSKTFSSTYWIRAHPTHVSCCLSSIVSTKWLDSRAGRSAGILPANAAKMAALQCPANYWTLHQLVTRHLSLVTSLAISDFR